MEPDLILFIAIDHETVFGVCVEWALVVVSILFNFRETNTKQSFCIVDQGIDDHCLLMLCLPSVQMRIRSMPSSPAVSTMTRFGLPSRSTKST